MAEQHKLDPYPAGVGDSQAAHLYKEVCGLKAQVERLLRLAAAAPGVVMPLQCELRERLGRTVRDAWVARQREKRNQLGLPREYPPWEQLTEFERETDRCIADAVLRTIHDGA